MASVVRTNVPSAALEYISTRAFHTYFFSYSTSINPSLETVGSLTQVVGATALTCPAGRVLRENGRKLFPGANPGITTYMVGVYDAQSLLSGFIDPNAKVFQIYNTDKPSFLADGVDPTTDTRDLGPSVYTRGGIYAEGAMDISGGATIYGGETVYGGETIATGNLTVSSGNATITSGSLTVTNGKLNLDATSPNAIVGTATMTSGTVSGGFKFVVVNTTAVTASSRIFLTLTGQNNAGIYSVESIVTGTSFRIVSNNTSDASSLNWLIIN